MACDRSERHLGASSLATRFKMTLIAGTLPMFVGCGGGYVEPDPESFPPEAPNQQVLTCPLIVNWVLPTERESGAQLRARDIEIVTIYAAQVPWAPDNDILSITAVDPFLLQWQFNNLIRPATWYFRLTVTDTNGLESDYSKERSNAECL
jgi:hypothetical protein